MAKDALDDLLDVVVLEPRSLAHLAAFWALVTIPSGKPLSLPGVRTARLRRAVVESEAGHEVEAHVNGEGIAWTPLALEPGGIVKVLVP